ncbi:FeoB-associated Cys-rich membrane protein [Flavobacterium stagni]|uniref:FeoB-associated Cys-rich membrane protein n=1 Tax=Flavobacterium stagni TaxID=2506421 RepID=A0A4Q1KDV3_9FLAO|nr:FeoB-associated Cys-rich membrane protein [Flavobacterium stagni]
MNFQEIFVYLLLGLSVAYLYERFKNRKKKNKDKNCGDNDCGC